MAPPATELRTEAVERCPVCGGTGRRIYEGLHDDLFGTPGDWQMQQCQDCDSLWLDPRPTPEDLPLAYAVYYTHADEERTTPPGGDRLKRWLPHVPGHGSDVAGEVGYLDGVTPGRVLDVGCGDGRTLVALAALGWQTTGIDPDPVSIESARAAGCTDVRRTTIDQLPADEPFDAITSLHAIEHVADPAGLLADAHRLLRPGGTISIAAPNAESWLSRRYGPAWRGLEPPRHLQVFSPRALVDLVREQGFDEVTSRTTARGANGIVRARHDHDRRPGTIGRVALFASGEIGQAWEATRLRVRPTDGEELVVVARRP